MQILSNTGNSLISPAVTGKPHWNIYCTIPVVFRQTDLPPALGPEITNICFSLSSCISSGTSSFFSRLRVCASNGWNAFRNTILSSSETMGLPALFSTAQRALARTASISARYSPATAMGSASGRSSSVNSVKRRTISRRSAYSSSLS